MPIHRDRPDSLPPPPPQSAVCLNCGTPLTGPYCHRCGQEDTAALPTFAMLVADLWENFVAVDRKLLRTVGMLLFQPGAATAEHLSGKRSATVSPYKIYFWTTALLVFVFYRGFFIEDKNLLAAVPQDSAPAQQRASGKTASKPSTRAADTVFRVEIDETESSQSTDGEQRAKPSGTTESRPVRSVTDFLDRPVSLFGVEIDPAKLPPSVPEYEAAQEKLADTQRDSPLRRFLSVKWIRLRDNPADFLRNLIYGSLPNILLIAAPSWAAFFLPFFRTPRRKFVEHLVFSLHAHTVGIWLILIGLVATGMHRWVPVTPEADPDIVLGTLVLASCVHMFLAARRVYRLSPWALLARGGCLNLLYVFLAIFAILIGLTLTFLWNLIGL